jgi:hypothetical protein
MNTEVVRMLKEALAKAESGKTVGVAIVEVVTIADGRDWVIDLHYSGPLLSILAGTSQLAHLINEKAKPIST